MIRPLLGIVVATTQNDDEKHKEHGRAVLLALHQVSRLLQWDPFLFLVNPTGATRYVFQKDGKWDPHAPEPSAVAAYSMRAAFRSADKARLLLVHLGTKEQYIHPGLLPWVALYSDGSDDVLSRQPTPIHRIVPPLLAADSPVLIAASDGPVEKPGNAVECTWTNLMSELKHDDKTTQ
jgi:hypothetical protein